MRSIKKIISAIAFLLVLLLCISAAYRVLAWKDTIGENISTIEQLYATDDDLIDLVFLGTSHIYYGVSPAEIWKERGISSFNLAASGMDKVAAKHFLIELFKTQSPSVVCVDLFSLFYDEISPVSNEYRNFLPMTLSSNSVQAVLEYGSDNTVDLLTRWPIVHSRYEELTSFDFVSYSVNRFGRGQCYDFHVTPVEQDLSVVFSNEVTPLEEKNKQWLAELKTLCEEHNCTLITTFMPSHMTSRAPGILNGAKEYLETLGVEYIEMNQTMEEYGLSYETDFLDPTHLNSAGAQKATHYLLDQLCQRFDFTDHRGDSRYSQWDECVYYDTYQWQKHELDSLDPSDKNAVLAQLAQCPGLTTIVSVSPDFESEDTSWQDLLLALGATPEQVAARGQWMFSGNTVLGYAAAGAPNSVSIDIDKVHTLTLNAKQDASVYIDGTSCEVEDADFSIVVYDNYENAISSVWTY